MALHTTSTTTSDVLRIALEAYLGALLGGPTEVSGLTRMSGGASRETWAFTATTGDDRRDLILRRDPPNDQRPATMAAEAEVLRTAARHGVPVPVVHGHGDGTADGLGSPFLLMERLDGETIPRRLQRDERFAAAREVLVEQLATALARIHAIPAEELPSLPREPDPVGPLMTLYSSTDERRPVIELALRWLTAHRPTVATDQVVHGDFRLGNVMVDEQGLRGVLDWELAHIGDPVADLGWLLCKAWRFGSPAPVAGLGTREQLVAAYVGAGGTAPSPEALHWWEVLATVQWAVQCRFLADRHLLGDTPSLEYAALGRRVCELEHDVLLILGHARATPLDDVLDAPRARSREHGQDLPGGDDLLGAARSFLADLTGSIDHAGERFHLLVARNVIAIAQREMVLGDEVEARLRASLDRLGFATDDDLASAIESGSLDDRTAEVGAELAAQTIERLRIANPAHAGRPSA